MNGCIGLLTIGRYGVGGIGVVKFLGLFQAKAGSIALIGKYLCHAKAVKRLPEFRVDSNTRLEISDGPGEVFLVETQVTPVVEG